MPAIERRVDSLERTLRSWRRAVKVAGVACAVTTGILLAALLGPGVPPARGDPGKPQEAEPGRQRPGLVGDEYHPRTVEADRIVVLDHQGRQRIVMDGGGDQPGVTLLDATGKKRLTLRVDRFGGNVELLDAEEKVRACVRVAGETAFVELGGSAEDGGEPRVALRHRPDSSDGLFLAGAERGEPAASIVRGHDGEGRLEIRGKTGRTSVTPSGFDTRGKAGARATLGTHQGNMCILSLHGPEQKARTGIRLQAGRGQHTLEVTGPDGRSGIQLLARQKFSFVKLRDAASDGGDLELRIENAGLVSPEILFHKHIRIPGGTSTSTPFLLGMRVRDSHPYMVMQDAAGHTVTVAPGLGLRKTEIK